MSNARNLSKLKPSTAGLIETDDLVDASVTTSKIADAGVTPTKLSQKLTSGTAQATTSGTNKDFNDIPSWVKKITISFAGLSTNGTGGAALLVQVGDSSGVKITGYVSGVAIALAGNNTGSTSATNGFVCTTGLAGVTVVHGVVTLALVNPSTNTWAASGALGSAAGYGYSSGGSASLSGVLDRVRITTTNGTDAFDAGSVNILYE